MSNEWNGGGLPPVGIEVRVKRPGYNHPRFDRFIGRKVTVVSHDRIDSEDVAVFRMKIDDFGEEYDYHALTSGCYEPVISEHQLERLSRIEGMSGFIRGFLESTKGDHTNLAEALYEYLSVLDRLK